MELKDIARRLPDDLWEIFAPLLPPVVWCGNGRPPKSNKVCLHGLLFVLVSGLSWEMLPPCWPSDKTIQRCLTRGLHLEVFRTAWGQLAQQYEQIQGINWDQMLLDGSKKPAKKGGGSDRTFAGGSRQVWHRLAHRVRRTRHAVRRDRHPGQCA